MERYSLVEPHPSTLSSGRPAFHTGRGGTGNVVRLDSSSSISHGPTAAGPASLTPLDRHVPKIFKSGRGGAGNMHQASERAIFSFDEELQQQMRRDSVAAPVYHVGRGGAGNMVYSATGSHCSSRTGSMSLNRGNSRDDRASTGSTDSAGSDSGIAQRARRSFEKGWEKIVGH